MYSVGDPLDARAEARSTACSLPDAVKTKDSGLTSRQVVAYTNDNTMPRLHSETTSNLAATARVVDGFVTTQTDHQGITGTFTRAYTATGITQTATDGRGNTTTTHTDLAGRSISSTDAAGNTTATVYDEDFDQPSVVTNAQGKTSCYKYDLRGRKVAEWGTAIQPALFGYDDADNLTALTTFRADSGDITTDPSERTDGDTTTWAYHPAAGVELSKTYADNSQVVKTYDAFNRPATETNARGIVKTLSYDAATGQLTGISFSDDETPSQSFAYNILGQLTQVTDAAGTRTLAYNEYSELQSDSLDSGAHTHLVTELRDSYGRSTGFTYARSGSTQFTTSVGYATDGRIATAGFMHGGVNRQFSYGYLSGSNLLHTLTQPNGLTLTQSYEEHRDLLTDMQYHRGSTLVVERSYSYDTLGRPTNRSTARQGSVKNDTFTHNDRSELVSATLGTDAYSYSYDNIGNRKTAQEAAEEATAYDANNLNQYTAIQEGTAEAFVPTFDADGNQTKVKTSTGIWNVVYNAENRPVTFTSEDGATVVECTYDYMGRRHTRKITVNGSVTNYLRYIYRGYLQIAAINAVSGVFQWFILWDPTQPVATRPLGIRKDGTWYTYGWDLTKNICEVFSSGGTILTAYTYTPYGSVTATGNVTQPIQWSSEYNDTELGLVYYNYRHYNPADGRWIGEDPICVDGSYNLYAFVKGTTYLTDFRGLFIVGALISMAMDFSFQVISNAASNKPLLDIDYTSILISGVAGAILPGLGSKFVSGVVQSFRRSRKVRQIVPKITNGRKLIYKKSDIRYIETLLDNDRLMWSAFAYEAVTVSLYKQVGTKCAAEWCKCNGIDNETITEPVIIIIEKIKIEGEIMMQKIQNNSYDYLYPYYPTKRYYLD